MNARLKTSLLAAVAAIMLCASLLASPVSATENNTIAIQTNNQYCSDLECDNLRFESATTSLLTCYEERCQNSLDINCFSNCLSPVAFMSHLLRKTAACFQDGCFTNKIAPSMSSSAPTIENLTDSTQDSCSSYLLMVCQSYLEESYQTCSSYKCPQKARCMQAYIYTECIPCIAAWTGC